MAAGAADGLFRRAYDSSLSWRDNTVENRPYHRNCGCPLHKTRRASRAPLCTHSISNISFPMKKSWSESCQLALMASPGSSPAAYSPAAAAFGRPRMAASTVFGNDEMEANK